MTEAHTYVKVEIVDELMKLHIKLKNESYVHAGEYFFLVKNNLGFDYAGGKKI